MGSVSIAATGVSGPSRVVRQWTVVVCIAGASIGPFSVGTASPAAVSETESICEIPESERLEQVEPFEACGVITVSGVGGSFVRIRVPEAALVDFRYREEPVQEQQVPVLGWWRRFPHLLVDIDGTGPYRGVLLVAEGPPPPPGAICAGVPRPECPPMAAALELDESVLPESVSYDRWSSFNLGFDRVDGYGHLMRVPAGVYRVFVVGDRAREHTVQFRFSGLAGWNEVATEHVVADYENRFLDARLDLGTGQRSVQSFGTGFTAGTYAFKVVGFSVGSANQVNFPPHLGVEWGLCSYFDDRPAHDEIAYLPFCPSGWVGGEGAFEIQGNHVPAHSTTYSAANARGATEAGVGWWYASYGVPERGTGLFLKVEVAT